VKIPKKPNLKKECDVMWAKIVKLRAGNKSELSGKTERLNAHHVFGKPNLRLRYELDNGVCLTNGEHFYIAHIQGRKHLIEELVRNKLGKKRYQELEAMCSGSYKSFLPAIKIYLQTILEGDKK
jgi:hypothetical protein